MEGDTRAVGSQCSVVGVVPHDPAWSELFAAERRRLEAALEPWLNGGIHHIGSTAVPDLAAKPIIDMIAGVRDLEEARGAFEPLAELGYEYFPHRPEAHAFRRSGYGVHLTVPGSAIWSERLAFRDALRADSELAAEYEAWKKRYAAPEGWPYPYMADKREFVAAVLERAGIDVRPDEERLSAEALAARRATRRP
jgi:GrpB-like predicted nucleotidyltransferase (UPF0157 family)